MALAAFLNPGGDLAAAVDCVKLAETLGYDSAWVTHGLGRDSFLVLAAYAAATSRIGLGNGVVYSAATSYALIDVETDDAAEASAALSAARVLGFAIAIAISTSMMTTIDDADPGNSWGLRVALLVGAAITAVGWWLARRAPVATAERR